MLIQILHRSEQCMGFFRSHTMNFARCAWCNKLRQDAGSGHGCIYGIFRKIYSIAVTIPNLLNRYENDELFRGHDYFLQKRLTINMDAIPAKMDEITDIGMVITLGIFQYMPIMLPERSKSLLFVKVMKHGKGKQLA